MAYQLQNMLDVKDLLARKGKTVLGERVFTNRVKSQEDKFAFKRWGAIIRVGKRNRVDIKWADDTISRNQYLGDYVQYQPFLDNRMPEFIHPYTFVAAQGKPSVQGRRGRGSVTR